MCLQSVSVEHPLQHPQLIRFTRRLVPADAVDPREAHGDAGLVAGGALQALEGDFDHQSEIPRGLDRADGAEAVGGVVAHELVELFQFLVGEAEIGLAHGGQDVLPRIIFGPDAEGEVGIEAGAFAVPALGIHQHGIDQHGVAFPLEPRPLGAARLIIAVPAFQHEAFGEARVPLGRIGAQAGQFLPA